MSGAGELRRFIRGDFGLKIPEGEHFVAEAVLSDIRADDERVDAETQAGAEAVDFFGQACADRADAVGQEQDVGAPVGLRFDEVHGPFEGGGIVGSSAEREQQKVKQVLQRVFSLGDFVLGQVSGAAEGYEITCEKSSSSAAHCL